MNFNELISLITNGSFIIAFTAFIIMSYLVFALFSWSFIKPCKYMGISLIIVGAFLLIIRFGGAFVFNQIEDLPIPSSTLIYVLKPILIMGIVYIPCGIGLIVLQHFCLKKGKQSKNIKENK